MHTHPPGLLPPPPLSLKEYKQGEKEEENKEAILSGVKRKERGCCAGMSYRVRQRECTALHGVACSMHIVPATPS